MWPMFCLLSVVNECLNKSLNDCDTEFGECVDTLDSYVCRCKLGFTDEESSKPGRRCSNGRFCIESTGLFFESFRIALSMLYLGKF